MHFIFFFHIKWALIFYALYMLPKQRIYVYFFKQEDKYNLNSLKWLISIAGLQICSKWWGDAEQWFSKPLEGWSWIILCRTVKQRLIWSQNGCWGYCWWHQPNSQVTLRIIFYTSMYPSISIYGIIVYWTKFRCSSLVDYISSLSLI